MRHRGGMTRPSTTLGDLIDGAVHALVDGLESPSPRELAGASPSDRSDEIQPLLDATLDELDIPRPGGIDPWQRLMSGGRIVSRLPKETIRFEVAPAGDDVAGHQLLVFVDEIEMTSKGAGLGMDPFDVLVPENRLIATADPNRVSIARCECGEYGCRSTDVTIVRNGDVVHWDWLIDVHSDTGSSSRPSNTTPRSHASAPITVGSARGTPQRA